VTPEGTFSGIVDLDDLCFGDPRYVVALTLASLLAAGGPPDYVDAWMKIADLRDDGCSGFTSPFFSSISCLSTARTSIEVREHPRRR
jgi:hypothetical protein